MADWREVEPKNPDTLINININNLVLVLQRQGKYDEPEPLHRGVLGGRENVLEPNHPHTLTSMTTSRACCRARGSTVKLSCYTDERWRGRRRC